MTASWQTGCSVQSQRSVFAVFAGKWSKSVKSSRKGQCIVWDGTEWQSYLISYQPVDLQTWKMQ